MKILMRSLLTLVIMLPTALYTAQAIVPSQANQLTTPKQYYDYKYLHSSFRTKYWEDQKNDIKLAVEKSNNDQTIIKKIINRPKLATTETGFTPICGAIEMNDLEFAQYLLNHKAEVNGEIKGMYYSRPIFCVQTLEMVQLLERNGADIYVYNENTTFNWKRNLLHSLLHDAGVRDDRLIAYLVSIGFNLKDKAIDENDIKFQDFSGDCCKDRLQAHLEKIHKLSTDVPCLPHTSQKVSVQLREKK